MSQPWTRFGIHQAAGWRFPNTTLMDILDPHCTIKLPGFHQKSKGDVSPAFLPNVQFHPAKTSHGLKLNVMTSSDLQLPRRVGRRVEPG